MLLSPFPLFLPNILQDLSKEPIQTIPFQLNLPTSNPESPVSSPSEELNDLEKDLVLLPSDEIAKISDDLLQSENSILSSTSTYKKMEKFPDDSLNDFKHIVYNLLVENHNDPSFTLVKPIQIEVKGILRTGFQFSKDKNPEKIIPELYAKHIRKGDLREEKAQSMFIQDLYKFYMRASVELMSKYFEKRDKLTYLDEEIPLFIPNGSFSDAEERIKKIVARTRRKRKRE